MASGLVGQREADKRWRAANPEKVKEQRQRAKLRKTEMCPKCGGSGGSSTLGTKCPRCNGNGYETWEKVKDDGKTRED